MDEINTSVETTEVVDTTADNPTAEKTFTQSELDNVVKTRLAKSEKTFYTKLGIEKKEDLDAIISKLKDYDALKSSHEEKDNEIASLKAEKVKGSYLRVIEKANVDDEFIEFVYSKVEPKENEKIEDYKARVDEYISAHKNVLNIPVATINTSVDLSGKPKSSTPQTLREALREKYKK
jgi:hypothetical protein